MIVLDDPLMVALALLSLFAIYSAIVAGAVRYYIRTQMRLGDLDTEAKLRESIQDNNDAINRAFKIIWQHEGRMNNGIEARLKSLERRIDKG